MIHIAKGYLDSSITDVISKHKIRELLQINEEDLKRAEIITKERAFPSSQDIYNKISEMPADERKTAARFELYKGIMKDRQQDGFLISYPFGDVVKQPNLSFFYRGENRVYPTSTPSLTRVLLGCSNDDERAVEALIARLRIKEFILLIKDFEYIEEFSKHNIAILYEVIAQHYGLKTFYLDITSNFEVALFFACCRYDEKNRQWEPLSKKQIYEYEYGVLFQSHSHLNYCSSDNSSLFFPVGYQPFFRCTSQYAWAVKLKYPSSLTESRSSFRKFRFHHDSVLADEIYQKLEGGKLIYPEEGLNHIQDIIDQITTTQEFTKEAVELLAEEEKISANSLIKIITPNGYSITSQKLYLVEKSDTDAINDFYIQNNQLEKLSITTRKIGY